MISFTMPERSPDPEGVSDPAEGERGPRAVRPVTHAHEGGVVVFNIGMTLRQPWRVDLWGTVGVAMRRMLVELTANREAAARGEAEDLGLLGAEMLLGPRGPWVVQYWRSVEDLYAYARNRDAEHLPAWRAFNLAARRRPGAVGIWHETFVVPAGGVETFYGNGAEIGLAAATGTVPAHRRGRTARERLTSGATLPAGPGAHGASTSPDLA